MRVLYHHRTRGTDAQRVHILEMVNALREIGHEVYLAEVASTGKQDARREASEPAWKRLLRKTPFAYEAAQIAYNLFGFPWLVWNILARNADFVYERYSLFCCCGVFAARLTGRPIVLEVNSPLALEQARDGDIRAKRLAAWTEKWICGMATRVIVVSGPLRRILVESGVDAGNLELLPNGINLKNLNAVSATAQDRARLGIEPGQVVIGFVGWFKKWHGLEFLVETFDECGLAAHGSVLMLVGDGPAMSTLRGLVEQRGLRKSVIFTGPVPHEEIPTYLHLMDIAVQPAANEYCCPMKIIEYMGVKKAIVAPRQENICEILTGGAALFFEPGDRASLARCLKSVTLDADLRHQLGQRAGELVHLRGMEWTANAAAVVQMARAGGVAPNPHRRTSL